MASADTENQPMPWTFLAEWGSTQCLDRVSYLVMFVKVARLVLLVSCDKLLFIIIYDYCLLFLIIVFVVMHYYLLSCVTVSYYCSLFLDRDVL